LHLQAFPPCITSVAAATAAELDVMYGARCIHGFDAVNRHRRVPLLLLLLLLVCVLSTERKLLLLPLPPDTRRRYPAWCWHGRTQVHQLLMAMGQADTYASSTAQPNTGAAGCFGTRRMQLHPLLLLLLLLTTTSECASWHAAGCSLITNCSQSMAWPAMRLAK
jgi:hypothetical protein